MAFVSSYGEVEKGKRGATRACAPPPPSRAVHACVLACLSCLVLSYVFSCGLYIPYAESPSIPARHNQQSVIPFHSSRVAFCPSPSRTSARTEIGRAGLRNPTPSIETPARVLRAIRFLRSVFRDCSPARSSSSTPTNWDRDRLHHLPSGRSGLRLLHLLPGGRSRDCTTNIFLCWEDALRTPQQYGE